MNETHERTEEGIDSVFRHKLNEQHKRMAALRGTGRTRRACQRVADYLATRPDPQNLIVWRIPIGKWVAHITPMLRDALAAKDLVVHHSGWSGTRLYLYISDFRYALHFLVAGSAEDRLRGIHNVHWVYDEGECFDYEYLHWLDRMAEMEPQSGGPR